MEKFTRSWQNYQQQNGIRFVCGYCGTDTTPSQGWNTDSVNGYKGLVLICSYCNRPTFVEVVYSSVVGTTPSPTLGDEIIGLPDDIQGLYDEARKCTSISAYTSAVLSCRKILMHVAVEKGAKEGKNFIEYVDFLAQNGYIPPDGKEWVDHIRSKANEANHEIAIMGLPEADDLISFTEMLLRLVYEFKHRLNKKRE